MSEVTEMRQLSTKIRRMVGAKRPPDEQRLMVWYEDALDLENACRNWEKATELLRSKFPRDGSSIVERRVVFPKMRVRISPVTPILKV